MGPRRQRLDDPALAVVMSRTTRLRRLQAAVFTALLNRVGVRDDVRFLKAFRVMVRMAPRDDLVGDLLRQLTPDPVTGVSEAFREYTGPVGDLTIETLGPEFRTAFESAVTAYLE